LLLSPPLLGRVGRGEIKQFSFAKCFLLYFSKAKRIGKKEFILTSPHPTLPSKGGL